MNRRDQIKMTEEEVRAFVEQGRTVHLATISRDGSPHLVPLWYVPLDGDIAVETYSRSQKVENLRRDPRITAMLETGDVYEELRGVQISGKADIIEDPDYLPVFFEKLYERYWGPITDDATREGVHQMARKRVVVVVRPEKVVSWDHRKLGGGH